MRLIGIDPGKGGAIACWNSASITEVEGTAVVKMPATERDLWELIAGLELGDTRAWIEHATGMIPGARGVQGIVSLRENYALCRMALIAAGIPFERVSPAKWQREFGLLRKSKSESDTAKKNRHKQKAQELFPEHKIIHATADALLILEYARRQGKG